MEYERGTGDFTFSFFSGANQPDDAVEDFLAQVNLAYFSGDLRNLASLDPDGSL